MFKPEIPVQEKLHASGTWRAIRSMAVPASVNSVRSSDSASAHPSVLGQVKNIEEEPVRLEWRNTSRHSQTTDTSLSKS